MTRTYKKPSPSVQIAGRKESFAPTQRFVAAIRAASAAQSEQDKKILAAFGLSIGEGDVLLTLAQAPAPHAMLPTEIQGRIFVTSGGLTKLLTQLESRGLVERWQSDDDRRVKPVCLTAKGLALANEAGARLFRVTDGWIRSALCEADAKKLTKMLEQLVISFAKLSP